MELDGADRFRLAAYRRAAERIRGCATPVAQLALAGKATRLDGIGATIEAKIIEFVQTGDLAALKKIRDRVPLSLVEVMRVPGLGPKRAHQLWRSLGVTSIEELRRAAQAHELQQLPGLGARSEAKILAALARPDPHVEARGTLLGRALPLVTELVHELECHPASDRVSEAGSVRRRCETVRDVDVIATSANPRALVDHVVDLPWVAEVTARGDTKASVMSEDGLQVDLRVVPPENYGNLLQHFTGSKEHNVALREEAVRSGLSVSEWGVQVVDTGEAAAMETEEELYEHLGYAWIPPELRENRGELEAARSGELPPLVAPGDLRGDLHLHSDWSDGRATIEQMALAAKARGLRYIAVCDHARRLRGGRIDEQAAALAELDGRISGLRVLSGVEVDIRADGSLDLADADVEARDWVVASVHSGFGDGHDRLTRRILAAIDHPAVDCIGHLTGRKLGRRASYALDLDVIFERAAVTGTCLEINGQPDRLDLRDVSARAAAAAGVSILVSSDAHSVGGLAYSDFAVSQARRAWLAPANVINTLPWQEVQALRPRHRRPFHAS